MRARASGAGVALPVLLALAAGLTGCLEVADGRARRDEGIGRASGGGVTVVAAGGLAHVRSIAAGQLHLWAQAPAFELTVTRDATAAAAPLFITCDNVLADAELFADTRALPVEPAAESFPTRRRFRLDPVGTAQTVTLRLRTVDTEIPEPFRVAVFADVQERIGGVGEIYARMNQDPRIRFVLLTGDLTVRGGVAELERFQRELRVLRMPVFATLGNHELGVRDDLFHDFFGRGNFSFAWRGARFTLLDSASATLSPLTYRMLDGWLAEGKGAFHFVGMHIPPLDPIGVRNGGFASRIEASHLVSRLAASDVDVTVYGHVHSFYAFANAGIPAYITGGGGALPERLDGIGRHFLTIDIDPETQLMQVAVVRVD